MGNFTITADEAAWLIKATTNTANAKGEPVDLEEITPEFVARKIKVYRNINRSYEKLLANSNEVLAGNRPQNRVLDGVFPRITMPELQS